MHFRRILAAFTGLGSITVGAPIEQDGNLPSSRGLKHTTKAQKRSLGFSQYSINVLEGSSLSQLARIAELQLVAQLETQVALSVQLETIKNNIRINSFRTQFSQVNCIIVMVTNVLDQRDPDNINSRYLLNQVHIDNGFPAKELMIMVTDAQTMTVSATAPTTTTVPTPTTDLDQNTFTSSLNLGSFGNILHTTAAPSASFHRQSQAQQQKQSQHQSQPRQISIVGLDTNDAPFAIGGSPFNVFDQPLLLPFGTTTPTNAIILQDPASIIFPNQQGIFVESLDTFPTHCLLSGVTGNGFLNLLSGEQSSMLYTSLETALAAQFASLNLGGVLGSNGDGLLPLPIIPPSVLAENPELASDVGQQRSVSTETLEEEQ